MENSQTEYPQRREAPRFLSSADVRVQPLDQPNADWVQGRVRDISVRGFYFFSPRRHEIGSRLRFSVPWSIVRSTKNPSAFLAGFASIVRCEELSSSGQPETYGIAVRIDEATPFE
jgi:PilZ domain